MVFSRYDARRQKGGRLERKLMRDLTDGGAARCLLCLALKRRGSFTHSSAKSARVCEEVMGLGVFVQKGVIDGRGAVLQSWH